MENEEVGFYGAILQDDPRDYKLGGTSIVIPKSFNKETFEYNQLEFSNEYGRNLCTGYAPIGMLSDLVGRKLTDEERKELVKLRTTMEDFDPSVGGYLVEGDNCIRKWWNGKNPNNQIRQFAPPTGSDEFFDALDKGHRLNIGYKGNKAYNSDADDGILDSVNIGITTYGHSTTIKRIGKEYIVDNYSGVKKFNRYSFRDFKEFVKSPIVFKTSYLFLFANDSMDAEIHLLKDKWKNERPDIIFNEKAIREARERLRK